MSPGLKLKAPLPTDLEVVIQRAPPRRDGWTAKDKFAHLRTTSRVFIGRKGDEVRQGPFLWTGPGDGKGDLATPEEVLHSLALDATCYLDNPTPQEFAREFGHDLNDKVSRADTMDAFNGCRKAAEAFKALGLDPRADCFQEA